MLERFFAGAWGSRVAAATTAIPSAAAKAAWLLASLFAYSAVVGAEPHDAHAHHVLSLAGAKRSLADYKVPDLKLVRDDGKVVALADEINDDRPVVLAFIYTSCTTVCPIVSSVLSEVQRKLGPARDRVHLMSISIDPEHDTPAVLREYAQRFGAGPEWQHYTGTLAASQAAQRAFDVYRGDKMSHTPAVLVRALPGARWTRIEGFATADELIAELPTYCLVR